MNIITAKSAGFCFGVKRAVEETIHQSKMGKKPIYTYGPVVHNEAVIQDLEGRGVKVINGEKKLSNVSEGTIIIRAHGVTKELEQTMGDHGCVVVNSTCPFVKKIHNIVEEHSEKGEVIVIVGDELHPEVQGIVGWCPGPCYVISGADEVEELPIMDWDSVCVVAQTTYNFKKFQNVVEKFHEMKYNVNIVNTICNATQERQKEAAEIASRVDGMIVIGGKNSSNSQKLYDICKKECSHTVFIQSDHELDDSWFEGIETVGITAGASTPNNIIEEVQTHVRKF